MTAILAVALTGKLGPGFILDVAFTVPATGVTALIGPSGSGKTSVLRALAGLDHHDGIITIGDAVWQNRTIFVPPHRRRAGYVPQGLGLLPHISVGGNLDYAARRAGPGSFDRGDVITRTGIAALLDRTPAQLSGGEMQRVSIARALVGQPRLLLMDEPLSGLDPAARKVLAGQLKDLFDDLAIPIVYVTHDAAEANRLTDRRITLRSGRIVDGDGS